eukprot:Hpha_TRINITY_DN14443_c0_g3::TRINITY_DN14443_c0_g3_i1::g.157858::m.157858
MPGRRNHQHYDGFGMVSGEEGGLMNIEMTDKERGVKEGWWYNVREIGPDPRKNLKEGDSDSEDAGEDAPWALHDNLALQYQREKPDQFTIPTKGLTWGDDMDSDEERLRDLEDSLGHRDRAKLAMTKSDKTVPLWFVDRELAAADIANALCKDLCCYVPFLLMFVVYFLVGISIEQSYYVTLGYDNLLTGNEIPNTMPYDVALENDGHAVIAKNNGPWWAKSFAEIAKADDWFDWFEGVVVYYLFYPRDSAECSLCPSYRMDEDHRPLVSLGPGANILVGSLRVRTIRVGPDSCANEKQFFREYPQPSDKMMLDTRDDSVCKAPPDSFALYGGATPPATADACVNLCSGSAICQAAAWIQWPTVLQQRSHCRLWSNKCEVVHKGGAYPHVGEIPNVTLWSKAVYGLTEPSCYSQYIPGEGTASSDPYGPIHDPTRWTFFDCDGFGKTTYGRLTAWPCSGHVHDIPFRSSYNDALKQAFALRGENPSFSGLKGHFQGLQGFVDNTATRFVVVEFFSYNPALRDVFSSVKFYVEIAPGGTWFSNSRFRNFMIWSPALLASTVFDVFFMCYVFYFFGKLIVDWRKRHEYLTLKEGENCTNCFDFVLEFWNLLDFMNLIMFFMVFGLKIAWLQLSSDFKFELPGDEYRTEMDQLEALYFIQVYINSLNSVLTFLKFLKYVRLNQRFAVLGRTMQLAAQNIFGIILIFFVVVLAYSFTANALFGNGLDDYRDLGTSFQSSLRLLLGDFDYDALREENRFVAFAYFWSFVILGLFLLLNFIIAVLSDAFGTASAERPAPDVFEQLTRSFEDLGRKCCNPCESCRATWTRTPLLKNKHIRFMVHWHLFKMAREDLLITRAQYKQAMIQLQYDLNLVGQLGQTCVDQLELETAVLEGRAENAAMELALCWEEDDDDELEEVELTELEEARYHDDPVGYIEESVKENGPDAKIPRERREEYMGLTYAQIKQIFEDSGWLFKHRKHPARHSKEAEEFERTHMPYDKPSWARFNEVDTILLRNAWWDINNQWELVSSEEHEVDERADLQESAERAGAMFLGTEESVKRESARGRELEALRREMETKDLGPVSGDAAEDSSSSGSEGSDDSKKKEEAPEEEGEDNLRRLLEPRSMRSILRVTEKIDGLEVSLYKAVRGLALLDKEVSSVFKTVLAPSTAEIEEQLMDEEHEPAPAAAQPRAAGENYSDEAVMT